MRKLAPLCALLVSSTAALGAMYPPQIDPPDEPFCYFSKPSAQLGVMDGREGAQVTWDGCFFTGSSELMFLAGRPLAPLFNRVKTLRDGHLPIISFTQSADGVTYTLTAFGWTLDGRPESNLIIFTRVEAANRTGERVESQFAAAARYSGGDHRCSRMMAVPFTLSFEYELTERAALRDGALLYAFDREPARREIAPGEAYEGPVTGAKAAILPDTPCCLAVYDLDLAPGETEVFDFKLPYYPDAEQIDAICAADFDESLAATVAFWNELLDEGLAIDLPERKVVDTYQAALVHTFVSRDKVGDHYVLKVNELQYDGFWVRDGTYQVRTLDLYGYHDAAEHSLEYFLTQQRDNGIIHQPPQLDGWGQALFAFGQHFAVTHDVQWARRVFPAVLRSAEAVLAECSKDEFGCVPPTTAYDNEAIEGRYTGHNFWALGGLRLVIKMAEGIGEREKADELRRRTDEYEAAFLARLAQVTAKTGGYIPPGLDVEGGCDWGNLLGVYPSGVLESFDPRVSATVEKMRRQKYVEGVMTYGRTFPSGVLHHYLTTNVTQTSTIRGEQQNALSDLYAMLAHTSATHAGFETSLRPWAERDPGGNYPPHGWFAVKYCAVLRNMLVREQGDELHLFSCLSPEWLKPGDRVAFRNAPTDFGGISARLDARADGATIRLKRRGMGNGQWAMANDNGRRPARLVIHVPWFVTEVRATCDGEPVPVREDRLEVSPAAREVRVSWEAADVPRMSYAAAVEDLKAAYAEKYAEYAKDGGKPLTLSPPGFAGTPADRRLLLDEMTDMGGFALYRPVAVSSGSEAAAWLVDGNSGRTGRSWYPAELPAWAMVDLGEERTVTSVHVYPSYLGRRGTTVLKYKLETSTDGERWVAAADLTDTDEPMGNAGRATAIAPTACRYVRVMLTSCDRRRAGLSEVRVHGARTVERVEPPATSQVAWTAERQTGAEMGDYGGWGFIGTERIVLEDSAIKAGGRKVRLRFHASEQAPIELGYISLARTDPNNDADVVRESWRPLSFDGNLTVRIPAGEDRWTDWIAFDLQPGVDHTVTFQVLATGGTKLWSDGGTVRFEARSSYAARARNWSSLNASRTHNLYFVSALEAGE